MVYLISGASRSGKSILANMIHKKTNISVLPTDAIMMAFFNGVPQFGIHPELWPDEIAIKLWDFYKSLITVFIENEEDYIIEGESFLPEHIRDLEEEYKGRVKSCFIGFSTISVETKKEHVKLYANKNDWLLGNSEEYITNHITNMIGYSKTIKKSCENHNVTYFDTSENFTDVLNQAMKFMLD